jgi:outer membrane protein OmpA-like peptidoglycan-associated protein
LLKGDDVLIAQALVAMVTIAAPDDAAAPSHEWVAKRVTPPASAPADAMGMDLSDVHADATGALNAVALDAAGAPLRGQLLISGAEGAADKLLTLAPKVDARLPVGDYLAVATVPGHLAQGRFFRVTADGKTSLEFRPSIASDPPRVSLTRKQVRLEEPIAFRPGSPQLARRSLPILDEVVDVLLGNPAVRLRIEARTDEAESPDDCMSLAHEQAREVMRYLTERGVAPSRLTALGYALEKVNAQPADDPELLRRLVFEVSDDD